MSDKDTTPAPDSPDAPNAATPEDDLVTTSHSITVKRRKLNYTATTGRVVLREEVVEDGKFQGLRPRAEVFLTAYTADDGDPATRPVVFAFNGGPGSASVWLHLGLFGPRRVVSGDAGEPVPPPYELVDNAETLLAHSDLVFIDPVSTGYSRAAEGEQPGRFHGFQGDVESVGEVIRLWTSRNGRWLSPKFLAGESYGTTRAAALAEHLQQRHGMYLNGLVLISAVLDFATLDFNEGNDLPYSLFLPTYAAIAHHHGLHGDRELADVLAEAEEFAAEDYPWALARGSRLTDEERAGVVARLAALTGLSEDYVDRVDLRIEHVRFFTELLRPRRRTVGRLDGRFTGWESDYGRELFSEDPSYSAILGPYSAALNHYARVELGYESDLPYEIISRAVHPWSYKEFEGAHVTVANKLAAAMRANPHLKVHVAFGYHDGATPYYAAEHVLAHLKVPRELAENVESAYYPAGHMMYVHEESRVQQSKDIAAFVRTASNR
ncbi:peptidase S10 [Actinosynnema pretiosum subsp. pretiosum]|uniref:Peptidase S10 serine carboxypeptidase n=2 Tax=Actinosynnema TaxID=40566 RepID=C6WKN9_ACTMD|nr:peptidase S10 [Actinosynnema mirum]ACU34644.1 peptidase S10 serine carboxypeptidase [Actinosynnema mirum DSM 43827]AXX28006.1 Carboxypeptidase-related protein [Actinosynnema pretiosum subsp. pretiosum]QUF07587.1 peptidase S10 [Actinosynnema pretiosum subsp. pretiosum]